MLLMALLACGGSLGGGCESDVAWVSCPHEVTTLEAAGLDRKVQWQVPEGPAPDGGWPVAWLFQGSLFPSSLYWSAPRHDPSGADHQVELTAGLLEAGYAVFTPQALGGGFTCWDTNLPGVSDAWELSADAALVQALQAEIDAGVFGDLEPDRLVVAGISSGGYMASRMAVTFPERVDAAAVVSASYATCAGVVCSVPEEPPGDHPPTLFVHGKLDPVVPIGTMWKYHDWLDEGGVPTDTKLDSFGVHRWSKGAPDAIVDWFTQSR